MEDKQRRREGGRESMSKGGSVGKEGERERGREREREREREKRKGEENRTKGTREERDYDKKKIVNKLEITKADKDQSREMGREVCKYCNMYMYMYCTCTVHTFRSQPLRIL